MSFLTLFLVLLLFICISSSNGARKKFYGKQSSIKDDQDGLCALMVQTQGYPCEEHQVTTKDGYILSMQRIPQGHSSNAKSQSNGIPVLLQHGLVADAATWLSSPTNEALGFVLADAGYDVWLSNSRGTNYSSGHTSLSPSDSGYWDWSWDELASYDLPACVQYVHDQTGQNLHYVGHSLGTLMAFAAFSQGNVYTMLRSAGLLSPIAYLGQIRSDLTKAAADAFIAETSQPLPIRRFSITFSDLIWLGINEFAPQGNSGSKLLKTICKLPGIDCSDVMSAVTGPNCCLDSSSVIAQGSQPTSTKNMIHLAQMIRHGTINMYDYGNEDDNNKHYGQPNPPNLRQVSHDSLS
ncbi:hypothetical protein Leryth_002238 [Lithospermum erythrorhizon]|nr:hypothetical protein Leryth_002238 [Lithospermum erythrorhizon]